jgi:RNA polymerase sigma-70 factor, ECF subfamily
VVTDASMANDPGRTGYSADTVTDARRHVTEIFGRCATGAAAGALSAEKLLPLVYDEMRRIAGRMMSRETPGHTLQPTALVHEAYLKLVDQTRANWKGRTHFLAVGAQVMRRLLINHARDRAAVKRGRSWERVALTAALARPGRDHVDLDLLIAINRAVEKLAGLDERQAAVVTLRFFGGLEIEEAAQVLGVSRRTVDYDWRHARAWLLRELAGEGAP